MREVNEDSARIRMLEYGLVILVLFGILIIMTPSLLEIINKSMCDSAKLNTEGTIDTIKQIYTTLNLTDEVALPFKMTYKDGKYTLYENGEKYTVPNTVKIEIDGKQASSGDVVINEDGEIEVKNLTFGLYTCNKSNKENVECKIKWS